MRSQEEIVERAEKLPFAFEVLIGYLDYEHAKQYLKNSVTAEAWEGLDERLPPLEAAKDYMDFAWKKALGHRGISASRSVDKMREWLWLEGRDEEINWDRYRNYGAPILRQICELFDWPWSKDDEEAVRMSEGKPCTGDCMEGCGW